MGGGGGDDKYVNLHCCCVSMCYTYTYLPVHKTPVKKLRWPSAITILTINQ